LFVVAVWWLRHLLAEYNLHDILARVHAIPGSALAAAVLLTLVGYACLTLYDVLGAHLVGAKIRYGRLAMISFMAYGIGHNVGMNTLSGGAIRFRAYSALGLTAKQIATIVAFGTATFGLGAATLLGASLLAQGALSVTVLRLPAGVILAAGSGLLLLVALYLVVASTRSAPVRLRRWRFRLPKARIAFAQVALACLDLSLSASILYVLLPAHAGTGFLSFIGLYIIAIAAGVLSTVPGGVGVFELVMLQLLPGVPRDGLIGSLLAYRVIYYLLPFGAALTLLASHELWAHREKIARIFGLLRTWLIAVTPQAVALAVFAAGAVLLFSGATPGVGPRLELLNRLVPLPILELSHLLGSVVGIGLLIIANGLYRRLDAAWWLTIWLLAAGIVASLLKGFDYEEALALGVVAAVLATAHSRFPRRASLIEQRFSAPWIIALLCVLGATIWLVSFAYRHVPYARDLWWQFALEADAPRSLRGLLLALILAAAYGLWRLLRPARPTLAAPSDADLALAESLIAANADSAANLALLADKNLLFNATRTAFIMYRVSGNSFVAMGDPVGPADEREPLAWEFVECCDVMAAAPVFYQVTPENLPIYVDLGLSLSKLGEEARVALDTFSLDGPARADLRQAHRRALREGAEFAVVPRAEVPALLPQLRAISDAWLAAKAGGEKGFSLGFFSDAYLARFDCAVVRHAGRIVAFANFWRAAGEASVDLMRYAEGAPKGVIDYLLIECMLWSKAQGYRWFNLGMAPLSGLEEHPLAPAWHKLGRLVTRYGENFYHFEGLRKYKEKFAPVWRPRYLAAPGGLGLAGALLDVTNLISGGVGKIWTK
jgi:phosphatidylglycerol lysyltransferase